MAYGSINSKHEAWENLMVTIDHSLSALTYDQAIETADEMKRLASMLEPPVPDAETGLVPCGCGGKPAIIYDMIDNGVIVQCKKCRMRTLTCDTKEEASENWNQAKGY
ncbi:MAG: hypothetical protein ACOX7B_03370 [Christensenellales bacterium]|jgi:hypothetical protein